MNQSTPTLDEYLKDPCGTLSIPYWKSKGLNIPAHMRIVHHRDYDAASYDGYADEPYFRLLHPLKNLYPAGNSAFSCKTAAEEDLPLIVQIINRSYTDLSVTLEQMRGYRHTAAFAPELWIIAYQAGTPLGCGNADFDPEAREGVLEWIQVLPEHRGRGIGRFIVNELLCRLEGHADFATVSGKVNSAAKPEMLYRKCGFTGEDVWHIMTKE